MNANFVRKCEPGCSYDQDPYVVVSQRATAAHLAAHEIPGATLCGLRWFAEGRHGRGVCRKCDALADAHDAKWKEPTP